MLSVLFKTVAATPQAWKGLSDVEYCHFRRSRHARATVEAVALDAMTGEVKTATFGYDAAAVAEWVGSLDPAAKCVYESGITGFDLQKRLAALGADCVVGAVSKMIKPSADRRRKNDRNDAEFLARMLSVGNEVVPGGRLHGRGA